MSILFTDLKKTFELHQEEYEAAALEVLRSGWYVLGKQLEAFEKEFADYLGMKHCIGVGCGQDALILAIRALGIGLGDEVICAGNTYIATVLGVTENDATPVLVDCNEFYQVDEDLVEAAITSKTKAVLLTNLYGQCSNLTAVRRICDAHGLKMVEDCAQSHGASFDGRLGGTVGDISCFSFYPTKPLGAFGDGGAIVTNDDAMDEKLRMLRNYGSRKKYINESVGLNSRLDEIQAAMLRCGLRHLNESNAERVRIANRYLNEITNSAITLPLTREGADNVYHVFPVRCASRDELKKYLEKRGIATQIHYPIPPHQAECYQGEDFVKVNLSKTEKYASSIISLPIYAGMPEADIDTVIAAINEYKGM